MSLSPTVSKIPFWGQAWTLTVEYASNGATYVETISTNGWEPESLRITFDITEAIISSPWWTATITIYNLNAPEIQNILLGATRATLSAGFQTGPALSSVIWDGPVFQVTYDQENIVDQRVILHCINSPLTFADPQSFSMGAGTTQQQLVSQMAMNAGVPIMSASQGTLSPYAQQLLNAKRYPRGITVFGLPGQHMDIVANDNGLQNYRTGFAHYMTEMLPNGNGTSLTPNFIYSPPYPMNPEIVAQLPTGTTQTIIGTPRQTPQGVVFTVLLDPRLIVKVPVQVVQLVRTLITQITVTPNPGGGNLATPFNNNLTFFVGQVRHVGDSRGSDWYTEVTGFSTTYAESIEDGILQAN